MVYLAPSLFSLSSQINSFFAFHQDFAGLYIFVDTNSKASLRPIPQKPRYQQAAADWSVER